MPAELRTPPEEPARQTRGDETSESATHDRHVAHRPAWRATLRRFIRRALVAVVLLVALIGFLFITRGTAVQHVRGVGADGSPVAPAEPQFPVSVAVLTGTVLTGGNRVEIALDGDGSFPRPWADLRAARRSITIQNYYGKPGRVADTLHRILTERAAAGIVAVPFRPLRLSNLWVIQNRSHVRGIVIDGRVGWTGGFGIDDK